MQSQILVVALVPGRESNIDVEIVETQQRGGSDCDESGVCVDALAGNCDGDGDDDDDDDDDIYDDNVVVVDGDDDIVVVDGDDDVVVDGDVDCVRQEEVREQEREAEMRDLEMLLADR